MIPVSTFLQSEVTHILKSRILNELDDYKLK